MSDKKKRLIKGKAKQTNIDPDQITGRPRLYLVRTETGASGVGAGGAVGGITGGLAGKDVDEEINPAVENEYWRENYSSRPYVEPGIDYEKYGPAYRYGCVSWVLYPGKTFDEVEADLKCAWEANRTDSRLSWEKARLATLDAWNRIEEQKRKTDSPSKTDTP